MTVRVYLAAGKLVSGPPEPGDIPAERVFVHAGELPELWVETESPAVPGPGKRVAFSLTSSEDFGFARVVGTVERLVSKRTRERLRRS
ncbi:MAG: hypothetical protein IT336_04390 [Thermomicrobiales bacterium]|nr:hypothetical protein [Thermomicrobiales bacterium]